MHVGRLFRELLVSTRLSLLSAGITGAGLHTRLYSGCWECDLKFSNMCGKHFVNFTIFPASEFSKTMNEDNFSHVFMHSNRQRRKEPRPSLNTSPTLHHGTRCTPIVLRMLSKSFQRVSGTNDLSYST